MNELSKERLTNIAVAPGLEPCDYEETYSSISTGEIQSMARELLALRERAEPVAEVCEGFNLRYIGQGPAPKSGLRIGAKLYAAPPASVVPDCLQRLLKHAEGLTFGSDWNNGTAAKYHRDALIQAVKDCRAAMLQGTESASQQTSDEHVRREYRMEGSIWVQCSKQEYDRKKAAGREVRELYERPQNAQQNIPENIPSLREAVTAIRNSGIAIDANKIQAERDALNALDVPDGWVLVPKRPTREMLQQIHPIAETTCPDCGNLVTVDCEDNVLMSWDDMLAAAPAPGKEG